MQIELQDSRYRNLYIALGLFFVSFALRFFYFLTLDNPEPYPGDSFFYIHYADNLIQHGVYSKGLTNPLIPDSYWAPGYPLFLVAVLTCADFFHLHYYPSIILAQALLGGFTVAFTFLVGRFFLSTPYALIGALLTTFSPHLMTLGAEVLSEVLLTTLLLISIYFYIQFFSLKRSVFFALLSGVFFGFAYLTNPVILFAPFLLVFRLLFVHQFKLFTFPFFKGACIFIVCFLIIVIGWSLRNIINVPADQPSSSDRAFENLVIGSHNNFHQMWRNNPRDPENPADLDMKQYKNDHIGFYRELTTRIVSEPGHYLKWYFIQKPLDLWGWKIFVGRGGIFVSAPNSTLYDKSKVAAVSLEIMKDIHYWLFGLAIIGILFSLREQSSLRKESILVVYISIIYISSVYVALHADARYSVPMRPEMYLCSMYAIYKLIELVKQKRKQT